MIRKIVLSNFMAHAKTQLELADGLTVLVGPNNIGKSTVAVALKILARNSNSNFVMQHDQKECSITVETSEGHCIQWIKRKSPSYVINGLAKDRLGRGGTPTELDDTLRLAPVEFEDKDFEPHFGDQKSPIFLINRPPSQIAQFFSTTSDAEKLVGMQRLHQRQRTEAQTQAKLLSARNDEVQQSLKVLESLPELELELKSLEIEAMSLESLATEILNLDNLIRSSAEWMVGQQLEFQRASCLEKLLPPPAVCPTDLLDAVVKEWLVTETNDRYFGQTVDLLHLLSPVPKLTDETLLAKVVQEMEIALLNAECCQEQLLAYSDLDAPSDFADTNGLQAAVDNLRQLETEIKKFADLNAALSNLTLSSPPIATEALVNVIGKWEQASLEQSRLDLNLAILQTLCSVPSIVDLASLNDAIDSLKRTSDQLSINHELIQQAETSFAEFNESTQQWLSTEPTCGTCGALLSADSIRLKVHHHGS